MNKSYLFLLLVLVILPTVINGQGSFSIDGRRSAKSNSWFALEIASGGDVSITPKSSDKNLEFAFKAEKVLERSTDPSADITTKYNYKDSNLWYLGLIYSQIGNAEAQYSWLKVKMDFGLGFKLFAMSGYTLKDNYMTYNPNNLSVKFDYEVGQVTGGGLTFSAKVLAVGAYLTLEAGSVSTKVKATSLVDSSNDAVYEFSKSYGKSSIQVGVALALGTSISDYTVYLFYKLSSHNAEYIIPAEDINSLASANLVNPLTFKISNQTTMTGISLGLLF